MNTQGSIPGTDEAWEDGTLGANEEFVGHLTEDELASDIALINESLGLQPISIRLERSLIEDFKNIATIYGLGYQTLMRQALKRFADCEKKRLLQELASDISAKAEQRQVKAPSPRVRAKKVA